MTDNVSLFAKQGEILIIAIYFVWTLSTWSTAIISSLRDLSSHGKTFKSKSGFIVLEIPKRWFLHFYLVGILSSLAVISVTNSFAAPFVLLQVLRRCYECLFIHSWRPDSKMYLPSYIVGLVHYTLLPMNLFQSPEPHAIYVANKLLQVIGAILCLYGQYEQHLHHYILAKLRREHPKTLYLLPTGRGFDYIGSPQYLTEILVYFGFLLMLQTRQASALLMWVASNQILNSWRTHLWYMDHFDDYRKQNRKAIIPFVL